MNEDIDEAVSALVEAVLEETGPAAVSITIDFQSSGECPYRVAIRDEILPAVGVARVESFTESGHNSQSSEAGPALTRSEDG